MPFVAVMRMLGRCDNAMTQSGDTRALNRVRVVCIVPIRRSRVDAMTQVTD